MDKNFLLNKFMSPLFAGIFVLCAMAVYYICSYVFSIKFGFFDIEKTGITEVLTYLFYGFGLGVACCLAKDFLNTSKQSTYFALIFLWSAALFREMGIQH